MRDLLPRTIVGIAAMAALAVPGVAWAGGGPAYSAGATPTPPTVDGSISAAEWADAPAYSLTFGNIPATVRFEHTATDLYVGVVLQDLAPGTSPSLTVYFDNNHDGIKNAGDDAWIEFTGQVGQDFFWDPAAPLPGGASHYSDLTASGGINDTIAAGTSASGAVTFEIKHPLCSADTTHDICASPGQTLGVDFQYEPGTTAGLFYDAPGPNTRDPSATWGDLLLATGDVVPPTVTVTAPAAGSVLHGTVSVAATASDNVGVTAVDFRYFGGALPYVELGTDTTAPYTATFDSTQVANTGPLGGTIYAVAHDAAGNTTTVGNGVTVGNGGSLSGTVAASPDPIVAPTSVDLTAAGSLDWAIWGYAGGGTSTSLAPDVRKADGTAISALTNIDPAPSAPLRGLGQFRGPPFLFNWTDGSSPASAANATGGIQHNGGPPPNPLGVDVSTLGKGFSFDVPADTAARTLTIYLGTNRASGQLTASLSDASAPDFTDTLPSATDLRSGVYTIHYAAASANQTLHVQFVETADLCPVFRCDNAALYAVALRRDVTGATSNLTTGASVIMSGSNVPLAVIPLRAFEPAPPTGPDPAPINGLPINGLPINGLPINGLPINGLPINGLPINGLPLKTPGGWAAALLGTSLAGLPLQTVTLQQVLSLPSPPTIKLGDLDLSNSALGRVTIGALALGSTPINGLGSQAPSIEAQLVAWCQSVASDPTRCTTDDIGRQSLFALALSGAPINGLPINGLPINGLPINGLPINGLPINGLPLGTLPINGLPTPGNVVDCTLVDCPTKTLGDAAALGAIKPGATLGDLHYYGNLTIGDLEQSLVGTNVTLGDLIGLLIKRADVPWETLSSRLLSAFDPFRPQLGMTAGLTLAGSGLAPATVKIKLPDGFDYVPGSATLALNAGTASPLGDPGVSGSTLTWNLPSVTLGGNYALHFSTYSGTDVSPEQATETVSSDAVSAASSASFDVRDSFLNSEGLPTITPDVAVQQSAIASRGAVDLYQIPMPPAGTRLLVHLTNLSADYDLALYANQTTSVRTGATNGAPLQDAPIPDTSINVQGGANAQLTPTALQDVPDPGIPLVQVSANRGTDDEDVGMVSPGGGGYATIAVFGYNGASSPKPYSLRVTTQAPVAVTCPARSFTGGGTAGTVPTIASLPNDLNTLILVNEKRIGDTYGASAESSVVAALTRFAGDRALGVSGAVIPVEGVAQMQYTTWDQNPCDVGAANNVANAIADRIAQVKAARPNLKFVVFAGGDDQIPFFRIPDLSRIANENGFAGAFGQNEYFGALASSDLLTDNPYLDTRPIPATGRQLFVPDLIGGRLVEKPAQIVSAIGRYETSNGTLARSTAFVSGYDFVSDGSALVQARLNRFLGTSPARTLINNTWSKTDLLGAAFPTGGTAAINDWNGHYDNHQALAANGDQTNLITTSDLSGAHALSGGIFFTMGCHAGFQTSDAIVGATSPDALDWSEYFAGTGTSFVGNTGFGLGNTDSVAFSEELMADLAGNLDGSVSIGQALARAKQDYYLSRTSFSSYDEKTLSEAELYGLPMYGIGVAPAPVGAPPAPPTSASPDPVLGASSSTSPSQGSLTALPSTSAQVASFDVSPHFSALQTGLHGQYFTNDGQVQAPNYRPLQPFVTLPATRTGATAHGVLIDGLTSSDVTPFNPDNVRPTVDLTANEPEPQFTDEAWPTKVPTLVSLNDSNGLRQNLNLTTGQFFTDSTTHAGVERKWTHIAGRVTYSPSSDFVPPTVDAIDAFVAGGTVSFSGRFSDRNETGAAGSVALAQVVYDVDNNSSWQALQLQRDPATGAWSGGAPFSGTQVQFFVEACDPAGNCGFSSNKGRYFNAQPLPAQSGPISLTPSRAPDVGSWYTSPLSVTASSTTSAGVSVSVDSAAFVNAAGPIGISGDGAHVVQARGSDGNTAAGVFLVDTSNPTPPVFVGIQGGTTPINNIPAAVSCTSSDAGSGLAGCVVTGFSTAYGTHTLTATATDNVGHTSTSQLTYTVGLQAGNVLPPVTAPTGDQTNPLANDLQVFKIKSTVPIKFKMYLDAATTSLMTTPPAGSIARLTFLRFDTTTDSIDTAVLVTSQANTGNIFRWTGSPDYQYIYNLSTAGQAVGTYAVTITVYAADGVTVLAQSRPQYFVLRS